MMSQQYKYQDLTHQIIGCAMEVHNTLGNGFQEVIYQRALAIELSGSGLNFQRELEMPIYYKEEHIGTRRADFLVEDSVMVELKAITELEQVHLAQALNYLEAYKLEIGLLINFGGTSLQFKRLINQHKLEFAKSANPKNQHSNQGERIDAGRVEGSSKLESAKSVNPKNLRFRQ